MASLLADEAADFLREHNCSIYAQFLWSQELTLTELTVPSEHGANTDVLYRLSLFIISSSKHFNNHTACRCKHNLQLQLNLKVTVGDVPSKQQC